MDGADGLVAVADEEARHAVDDKADDGERPEGPGQADVLDHCSKEWLVDCIYKVYIKYI